MRDPFQGYDQWKTASPWDEYEEQKQNCDFASAFPDYSGPYDLYRGTYKETECGATIGFRVIWMEYGDNGESGPGNPGDQERSKWIYCDDLIGLGTWKALNEKGIVITSISVSSIVEGVDECTDIIEIECDPYGMDDAESIAKEYWEAVEKIEEEAKLIWNDTHGCQYCWADDYDDDEMRPVDPNCTKCNGNGTIL